MEGESKRNEDGTFKDGHTGNPEGVNGHARGWQRYGDRAQKLAERYSTAEILLFGSDPVVRAAKLSYWDSVIVLHMARMIDPKLTETDSGADSVNRERSAMLDRIEGAPKQTIAGDPDKPLVKSDTDAIVRTILSLAAQAKSGGVSVTNEVDSGGAAGPDNPSG